MLDNGKLILIAKKVHLCSLRHMGPYACWHQIIIKYRFSRTYIELRLSPVLTVALNITFRIPSPNDIPPTNVSYVNMSNSISLWIYYLLIRELPIVDLRTCCVKTLRRHLLILLLVLKNSFNYYYYFTRMLKKEGYVFDCTYVHIWQIKILKTIVKKNFSF